MEEVDQEDAAQEAVPGTPAAVSRQSIPFD